jgi:hypothetical protein
MAPFSLPTVTKNCQLVSKKLSRLLDNLLSNNGAYIAAPTYQLLEGVSNVRSKQIGGICDLSWGDAARDSGHDGGLPTSRFYTTVHGGSAPSGGWCGAHGRWTIV